MEKNAYFQTRKSNNIHLNRHRIVSVIYFKGQRISKNKSFVFQLLPYKEK